MENIAVFLSGGLGTRIGGDVPKQYLSIAGKPVFLYALETILSNENIDGVVIVAEKTWQDFIIEHIPDSKRKKLLGFSDPGANRQLSIFNGMKYIKNSCESECKLVFIHDAARPFLTGEMIDKVFMAIKGHDGVMPRIPMKDTIYYSEDGIRIDRLTKRENLYAGQSPELFDFQKYYNANCSLIKYNGDDIDDMSSIFLINGSSEPAILAGLDVVMISGDEKNFKITTAEDIEKAKKILE